MNTRKLSLFPESQHLQFIVTGDNSGCHLVRYPEVGEFLVLEGDQIITALGGIDLKHVVLTMDDVKALKTVRFRSRGQSSFFKLWIKLTRTCFVKPVGASNFVCVTMQTLFDAVVRAAEGGDSTFFLPKVSRKGGSMDRWGDFLCHASEKAAGKTVIRPRPKHKPKFRKTKQRK